MRLTRNLCIDIIREGSREVSGVEWIDWVGVGEEIGRASTVDRPEMVLEREEKSTAIRGAIAELPERMRQTFIWHFYQQRSHSEISEIHGISYDNVCQQIFQGKKIIKRIPFRESEASAKWEVRMSKLLPRKAGKKQPLAQKIQKSLSLDVLKV